MKSVNAVTIKELYDLSHTEAKPLMEQYTYPWEVLPHIGEFIVKLGESLPKEEYTEVAEHVWVHQTAKVFASAYLAGPAIIGAETEVRQCAFVRGNALVGKGCVIDKSIIAENTKIGEGAILGIGSEEPNKLKPAVYSFGLVTIGENSVIPDHVQIGKNTAISGITNKEDYPDGVLGSGETLIKAGEIA